MVWHVACPPWWRACASEDRVMAWTISEERCVYLCHRQREVRCRLWYEVTKLREGLLRYFLIKIEELE